VDGRLLRPGAAIVGLDRQGGGSVRVACLGGGTDDASRVVAAWRAAAAAGADVAAITDIVEHEHGTALILPMPDVVEASATTATHPALPERARHLGEVLALHGFRAADIGAAQLGVDGDRLVCLAPPPFTGGPLDEAEAAREGAALASSLILASTIEPFAATSTSHAFPITTRLRRAAGRWPVRTAALLLVAAVVVVVARAVVVPAEGAGAPATSLRPFLGNLVATIQRGAGPGAVEAAKPTNAAKAAAAVAKAARTAKAAKAAKAARAAKAAKAARARVARQRRRAAAAERQRQRALLARPAVATKRAAPAPRPRTPGRPAAGTGGPPIVDVDGGPPLAG